MKDLLAPLLPTLLVFGGLVIGYLVLRLLLKSRRRKEQQLDQELTQLFAERTARREQVKRSAK
jgi:uncharacterized membrane-anchored protein YhcB (DUF1043 family)